MTDNELIPYDRYDIPRDSPVTERSRALYDEAFARYSHFLWSFESHLNPNNGVILSTADSLRRQGNYDARNHAQKMRASVYADHPFSKGNPGPHFAKSVGL